MLPALAQSLPIAIGILVSSLPLTMIPLILRTRSDGRALAMFLAGWTTGFLLVGVAVLLLADTLGPSPDGPSNWVNCCCGWPSNNGVGARAMARQRPCRAG